MVEGDLVPSPVEGPFAGPPHSNKLRHGRARPDHRTRKGTAPQDVLAGSHSRPIGPWILDFFCHAARLAVEIDGASHDDPDRMLLDRRRAIWLERQGISVRRVSARAVLQNLDGVLEGLRSRIGQGPLHRRAGGPPPPAGEECV
ncbi:endonuclease domain-containing protein [Brevundimonas sp.]|uniref:endonuclease domain-containing protein n=1 Tax=Brevundimonas sp. TaxID=1871086 RepID=UPI0039C8B51F